MASDPIPVITISGSHRHVGQGIGEELRPTIRRLIEDLRGALPEGISRNSLTQLVNECLAHTRSAYPHYVEELEGIAESAVVPFDDVFLSLCEELWDAAMWRRPGKGCTDLAARGRAVVNGATLLAHTNDLRPDAEKDLVILKVQAGDEPQFLGVSVGGLGYSAGYNAAGVSLTGNQLTSNDVRPGVPRLIVVRAILAARRLGEAVDACLLPQRASSYNNVVADSWGEIYSMEGSATDCEPIYIAGDILAHANHYASPPMRRFEDDRNDIGGSVLRHNRALRLLQENYGHLSPAVFQRLLADHANYPGSICKHGDETVTSFSMIIDLGQRRSWIGRGRPCETVFTEHVLDRWEPPQDWPTV